RRRQLRQEVRAVVLVTPELLVADDIDVPGLADDVLLLGVVRIPPVVIPLEEELHGLARREIDLRTEDVLVPFVEDVRRPSSLRETRPRGSEVVEPAGVGELI